ncbi:MAG: DUF4384 domain-containing protein [Deltaproteobacteria bacterium]|nr:DUF4384 domain-containing protein [Deltaproteobacteria bacterium]
MRRLILIFLLLMPLSVWASEQPIWLEAEGTAYMSGVDTFDEVVKRAKNDALRNAAERATGVFIKSHTYVSNSQLGEDLIYASVKSRVVRYEVLTEGWDAGSRNLYRVKVKALVEPYFAERKTGLTAEVSLSRYELKENDEIRIFYRTSEDAYVYIFSVAVDGSVTLLLPNSEIRENFAAGGTVYEFPPRDSRLVMQAKFLPNCKEPSAEERIKIIATRKNEELLALGFREGMFEVYDAGSTSMVSDLVRKLNRIDPENWAEASAAYIIVR